MLTVNKPGVFARAVSAGPEDDGKLLEARIGQSISNLPRALAAWTRTLNR